MAEEQKLDCKMTGKKFKKTATKKNQPRFSSQLRTGYWHNAAHETTAAAEGTPRRKARHETRLAATPGAHFPPGLAAAVKASAARVSAPADPRGPTGPPLCFFSPASLLAVSYTSSKMMK
jgi:hypothetical protein